MTDSPFSYLASAAALLLVLAATPAAHAQLTPSPANPAPLGPADTVKLKSGVRYWTLKPGTGERPGPGQKVWVLYTGRLADGHIFDTSDITGKPLKFSVGTGQVIPGMDEVVGLMRVGQKVTCIIPSRLGYGPAGQLDEAEDTGTAYKIPPNAELRFDVELVKVGK
jgi:FKBP-type peptidyl-prolyl cis-trans isomerase FkpA